MAVLAAAVNAEVVGGIVAWAASIVLTGWLANRKGRSVVGWALLAVFVALWAFVVVALLPSKKEVASATPVTPSPSGEPDQLAELRDLHDAGVLTDEEFEAKKTKVLTRV